MHSKGHNIKIMIHDEADEVLEEFFKSLKNRYENNLGSIKCSDFFFHSLCSFIVLKMS